MTIIKYLKWPAIIMGSISPGVPRCGIPLGMTRTYVLPSLALPQFIVRGYVNRLGLRDYVERGRQCQT